MSTASSRIKRMVCCAVFAALTAICSQIAIPLPLVPINLALFAVHLCGALMGPVTGMLSMVLYVGLGLVGVPVFSKLMAGPAVLAGPTGGYIIGYILCALIVGLVAKFWGDSPWKLVVGMLAGLAVCYLFGSLWFMFSLQKSLLATLTACVFPFLPGDAIKIALAVVVAVRLKKVWKLPLF